MQMRLIRHLSLLVLLAVLIAGTTSAQSMPPPTGSAKAIPSQSADGTSCSEPPHPQSVNADVDLCVDALVKADVQDAPGVRLDVIVLPGNDPELLASQDKNRVASRHQLPSATSWGPQRFRQELGATPTPSESASLSPAQSPAFTIRPSPEVADNTSLDLVNVSILDRNLARARVRKQEEARLRQSRQMARDQKEQCRQINLSNLECRLQLKNQKLLPTDHTGALPMSEQPANH